MADTCINYFSLILNWYSYREDVNSYQQQFRSALNCTIEQYLTENPNLETRDPLHYGKANTILRLAANLNITPILLWMKINNVINSLPSFLLIFANRFGSRIRDVLEQYPAHLINSHFIQEQYELNLRMESTRASEVTQLRSQTKHLQKQITDLSLQVETLNEENQKLKQLNQRLSEENLDLKIQLEKVLLSNDAHQHVADKIRQSLTGEIQILRESERAHKEKLATLVESKSELHRTCHSLEAENNELKEKNKRLAEINAKLLKEKLDAQQKPSPQARENQPTPRMGVGFFQ